MKRHRFKTLLTAGAIFFAGTAAHAADWHVDASASPGGNGMSWGTAFNTLTAALNNFQLAPGDSIFVAEGTYSPGTQASSTFLIPSGVQVYGGFLIGETFGEQNPGAHISTLDGGGNVRHVVTIQDSSEASQTILSGFTITGGNANGPNNQSRSGGGVLVDNDADSAQITRCRFTANSAVNGGAITIGYHHFYAPADFTAFVTNCTFFANTATASGGAVSATGSGVFMNCLFYENAFTATLNQTTH